MTTEITAGRAVLEVLRESGIDRIFGNPGTTEIPILDALAHHDLEFILGLHESAVVAAADGYARLRRQPAVVLLHSTPGTCNAVGALYTALHYGSPIVVLVGQQDSRLRSKEPTLDSDLVQAVQQFTKWAFEARHPLEVPQLVRRALKVAATPPEGPVFLTFPYDVTEAMIPYEAVDPARYGVTPAPVPPPDRIAKAADLLVAASSPVIVAGREVSKAEAVPELVTLAEALGAQVVPEPMLTTTVFPTTHPAYRPGGGLQPYEPRQAIAGADVVLAVGCQAFLEHYYTREPMLPPGCPLIHVHPSAWEIGKNLATDVGIVAGVKEALRVLHQACEQRLDAAKRRLRDERVALLREAHTRRIRERKAQTADGWDMRSPVQVARAVCELRQALPASTILIDESVRASTHVRHLFDFSEPDTYFAHGNYLGWGLGAAIGIKLARPDAPVVALVGDGSFMYGVQALYTMAKKQLPVITVVLNNNAYLAVKRGVWAARGTSAKTGRYFGVDLEIEVAEVARGYGIQSITIDAPDAIGPTVREALAAKAPCVIDIKVDPSDPGFGFPPIR
jgi:benzoylformate decarboxylase